MVSREEGLTHGDKIMKICLDSKYILSKDNYNWILIEKKSGKKERRYFFSNIKKLADFLGELKLRECLSKGEVGLCNKSSATPSYSSVIEEIIGKLEHYIESIIKGNDSDNNH